MGQGFQARPEGMDAIAAKLRDLQAQIDALRGAAPNRNSAISDGGDLTVLDPNGNQVVKVGHDSSGSRGFALTSEAGVDMLDFGISTLTPGRPVLDLNDSTGALAFATDPANDGTGIFWPFMQAPFAPMTIALWPFNTTGTFTNVAQASSYRFSQAFTAYARLVCDSGATAGQARLLVDGVQVGSTATVGTSVTDGIFSGLTGGLIRSPAFLQIQTRVTAGAGNCRAQVYFASWVPFAYI